MKYYLDCEFDGRGGELISMGLVSETGRSLYVVMDYTAKDEWVLANVVPLLFDVPMERIDHLCFGASPKKLSFMLETYFKSDEYPHVIADWPDDIKYLCEALITGPGTMINIPGAKFSIKRVDAYPTPISDAVQHNAWWDAVVLWKYLLVEEKIVAALG